MTKREKLVHRVKAGPKAVKWDDFLLLAQEEGFHVRKAKRGSGYIFEREANGTTLAVHRPHGGRPVDPAAVRELLKVMERKP